MAICFVGSLSSCWEVLSEDNATNGMAETLEVFEWLVERKAFEDKDVLVFLNKRGVVCS